MARLTLYLAAPGLPAQPLPRGQDASQLQAGLGKESITGAVARPLASGPQLLIGDSRRGNHVHLAGWHRDVPNCIQTARLFFAWRLLFNEHYCLVNARV